MPSNICQKCEMPYPGSDEGCPNCSFATCDGCKARFGEDDLYHCEDMKGDIGNALYKCKECIISEYQKCSNCEEYNKSKEMYSRYSSTTQNNFPLHFYCFKCVTN